MNKHTNKCFLIQFVNLLNKNKKTMKLSPTKRWIIFCLAKFANKNGQCWPSLQSIADFTGYNKSTIKRNLWELETDGFIRIEERFITKKGRTSNLFTIHVDRIYPQLGAQSPHPQLSVRPPLGAQCTPNISIEYKREQTIENVVPLFDFYEKLCEG